MDSGAAAAAGRRRRWGQRACRQWQRLPALPATTAAAAAAAAAAASSYMQLDSPESVLLLLKLPAPSRASLFWPQAERPRRGAPPDGG